MAPEDIEKQLLKAQEKLGSAIFSAIPKSPENTLISPLFLHAITSALAQGASRLGREVFAKSLHLGNPTIAAEGYNTIFKYLENLPNVELTNSTTMYISKDYNINPEFKDIITNKFKFKIQSVDFKNKDIIEAINSTLVDDGEGVPSLNKVEPSDEFVIVNSLSFKGKWECSFDEYDGSDLEQFIVNESESVGVHMMSRTHNYKIKQDVELNATVIEIPYVSHLSIILVVPFDDMGIEQLESKLNNMDLNEITQDLATQFSSVHIPKFRIAKAINLNESIKSVGLGDIFDAEKSVLSEILEGSKPLAVSKIIQQVTFEVNENGNPPPQAPRSPGGRCYCRVVRGHLRANHPFKAYVKSNKKEPHIIIQAKIVRPKW